MSRAAIYTRVSTGDKGQDLDHQRQDLRRYAESQGWLIVCEYQDQDSGSHAGRAGFQTMLRDASLRRFDVLLFWSLDRLTQKGALATLKYLNRLSRYGVEFRSFTERYLDSCGVFKDTVIAILGAIAQQERVRRSARVRAGLERARRRGTRSGRPVGRPRVVCDRAEVVRLRTGGWSWGRIARRLKISVAAARRAWEEPGGSLPAMPKTSARILAGEYGGGRHLARQNTSCRNQVVSVNGEIAPMSGANASAQSPNSPRRPVRWTHLTPISAKN